MIMIHNFIAWNLLFLKNLEQNIIQASLTGVSLGFEMQGVYDRQIKLKCLNCDLNDFSIHVILLRMPRLCMLFFVAHIFGAL